MDIFLMDLILKGRIPVSGHVLDAGCGEGRNSIYFIQNGYEYLGIDMDESKIRLAQYLISQSENLNALFRVGNIHKIESKHSFDLILTSRVLHFSSNKQEFLDAWVEMKRHLSHNGLVYLSMDSVIESKLGVERGNGQYEFPDGATRFALTQTLYEEIKKGFTEVEPLKTLIQHETRSQSFVLLMKD